ncbi:hypothetical protein [Mycobacterium sp.]|jgi:hypothetical protein|uniref:hypothetical protein n=1 Tax=Mycobacterium sp. TaxID=1785 RepID=UPI002D4CA108|nr:hypothetical protein [Mycobacterium sp.]HZA12685.1 hypothetical protein [Mycobacterium sp.]
MSPRAKSGRSVTSKATTFEGGVGVLGLLVLGIAAAIFMVRYSGREAPRRPDDD